MIETIDTSAWKVQTSVLLAQALVKAQRSDRAGKVAAATLRMASGIAKESRDQFIFAIDAIVAAPAMADTVAALGAARAATANLPPFYRTSSPWRKWRLLTIGQRTWSVT